MEKTYILGNNAQLFWAGNIPNAEYIQVQPLNKNNQEEIHDYVVSTFGERELGKVVFDLQESDAGTMLAIAMHLRLSYEYLGEKSFAQLIMVSDEDMTTYLRADIYSPYCQLFMTQKVWYCTTDEVAIQIAHTSGFASFAEFDNGFLKLITIKPDAKVGKHSLANQWGASVLNRVLSRDEMPDIEALVKAEKQLYFKYVSLQVMQEDNEKCERPKIFNATGKKILLIDDEAEKGWTYVLKKVLFNYSSFDVISSRVPNYKSLSDEERSLIEQNDYDLIFLDLRMNGDAEDNLQSPEQFSGMDILRTIKNLNRGTQVIILTASNKAWNMKALLDAGADGYYIKESPEYAFPFSVSMQNAEELLRTCRQCFARGYLREAYRKADEIKQKIQSSGCFGDDCGEILEEIDVALSLLSKDKDEENVNQFAYLLLFKTIEFYVRQDSVFEKTDSTVRLLVNGTWQEVLYNGVSDNGKHRYDSVIKYDSNAKVFIKESGSYDNRYYDTYFLVSAILLLREKADGQMMQKWSKLNYLRSHGIAHSLRNEKGEMETIKLNCRNILDLFDLMRMLF